MLAAVPEARKRRLFTHKACGPEALAHPPRCEHRGCDRPAGPRRTGGAVRGGDARQEPRVPAPPGAPMPAAAAAALPPRRPGPQGAPAPAPLQATVIRPGKRRSTDAGSGDPVPTPNRGPEALSRQHRCQQVRHGQTPPARCDVTALPRPSRSGQDHGKATRGPPAPRPEPSAWHKLRALMARVPQDPWPGHRPTQHQGHSRAGLGRRVSTRRAFERAGARTGRLQTGRVAWSSQAASGPDRRGPISSRMRA